LRTVCTKIKMENKDTTPKQADEVDVTQFFKWIGRGFTRLGDRILMMLVLLRSTFVKNRILFFSLMAICLVLGVLYYKLLKKPYYKATLVMSCEYLDYQVLENIVDRLELLCNEDEREGLSEELGISLDTAKLVHRFEARSFVSEQEIIELELLREEVKDLSIERKGVMDGLITALGKQNDKLYEISIFVYDPAIVRIIEKSVVNYFRNNSYIKRRIEVNRTNTIARKRKLERESRKLDSLKNVLFENFQALNKTSRGSNNVILGDERITNPLDVFREDLALHNQIMELDRILYLKPDFEIIEGFTTTKEPANFSLPLILFIAFMFSIFLGYLTIGMLRFDRMLQRYERDHSTT
jgi:hypothetical protein